MSKTVFPKPGQITRPENIPEQLRKLPWVIWKPLPREDGWFRKVPVDPHNIAASDPVDPLDQKHQVTFERACEIMRADHEGRFGIGVVLLEGCGVVCIDRDHDSNDPEWTARGKETFNLHLAHRNTYVELSFSMLGEHAYHLGTLPHGRSSGLMGGVVSIYGKQQFMVVTGLKTEGSLDHLTDIQKVLDEAYPEPPVSSSGYVEGVAADRIRHELQFIDPSCSRDTWISVGMAIYNETQGSQDGLAIWDVWSSGSSDKYQGTTDIERKWRGFKMRERGYGFGTLVHLSREFFKGAASVEHGRDQASRMFGKTPTAVAPAAIPLETADAPHTFMARTEIERQRELLEKHGIPMNFARTRDAALAIVRQLFRRKAPGVDTADIYILLVRCDIPGVSAGLLKLAERDLKDEANALAAAAKQAEADEKRARIELEAQEAAAIAEREVILDRDDPLSQADEFIRRECLHADGQTVLLKYHGAPFFWRGSHYAIVNDDKINSRIWTFLGSALCPHVTAKGTTYISFKPKRDNVANFEHALYARTTLMQGEAPCWLSQPPVALAGTPLNEIIPLRNVLYDLRTGTAHEHTPTLFNISASDIEYDAAATCPSWLMFLSQLFPDDPQSITTLQQIFGYLLSSDTSQHKLFMLNGPPRSGKGTILRVLQRLIGTAGYIAVNVATLSEKYGSASLVGKSVAVIPDGAVGPNTDTAQFMELLKSVSGEDEVAVRRMREEGVSMKLPTRFVIASNQLITMLDNSGAFASRIIMLQFTQSFLGREDMSLYSAKLAPELSGILNWALDGLRSLKATGRFTQPASAEAALTIMAEMSQPIKAFVDEHCELVVGDWDEKEDIYAVYHRWAQAQGIDRVKQLNVFIKELQATYPHQLCRIQPKCRDGKQRVQWSGIRLKKNTTSAEELERARVAAAEAIAGQRTY